MAELRTSFPEGLRYASLYDTTVFIDQSINAVYRTLFAAGVLVLLVIMLFLQNARAVLVPATTVPVTIIGAFAAMALLGFTVNDDAVRADPGDRQRSRRRDRHRRERLASHRARALAESGRHRRDGRAFAAILPVGQSMGFGSSPEIPIGPVATMVSHEAGQCAPA
jgi:AcrB/AcrD/AcrF family